MKTPKRPIPTTDAVRRDLSTSDSDAVVMLLAFLIVAVCGACQLVLLLPHALGAAMGPPRTDAPVVVAQESQDESRVSPAVPNATRQTDGTVARQARQRMADGLGRPDERRTVTR